MLYIYIQFERNRIILEKKAVSEHVDKTERVCSEIFGEFMKNWENEIPKRNQGIREHVSRGICISSLKEISMTLLEKK